MLALLYVMQTPVLGLKTNRETSCTIACCLQSDRLATVTFRAPGAPKLLSVSTALKLPQRSSSAPSPQSATPSQMLLAWRHFLSELQIYGQFDGMTGAGGAEKATVAAKAYGQMPPCPTAAGTTRRTLRRGPPDKSRKALTQGRYVAQDPSCDGWPAKPAVPPHTSGAEDGCPDAFIAVS